MIPVAHRGFWWPDRLAQNQLAAITAAATAGYGLELDPRLNAEGQLILQHDPHDTPWLLGGDNAEWQVPLDALRHVPVVMWDVKEAQAVRPLMDWLTRHQLLGNAVFFDLELAVPGWEWRSLLDDILPAAGYLRRASENESLYDALLDAKASGVWLDAWEHEWVSATTISLAHEAGKAVYVCSSELHQRPVRPELWRQWATAEGVCTDFPHLLAKLTLDQLPELQPAGWHAEEKRE